MCKDNSFQLKETTKNQSTAGTESYTDCRITQLFVWSDCLYREHCQTHFLQATVSTYYCRINYIDTLHWHLCIQWTHVPYSVVITSYPPISQFSSPCIEFTSVWSMFVYNTTGTAVKWTTVCEEYGTLSNRFIS